MEEKKMRNEKLMAQKKEVKETWEQCFGKKIEDKLNKKGIERFWDDNTSLDEATDMLTIAAIDDAVIGLIESLFKDSDVNPVAVAVVKHKKAADHEDEQDDKEDEGDMPKKCRVLNLVTSQLYDDEFDTRDLAKEFIRDKCTVTKYTVNDFKVVWVDED